MTSDLLGTLIVCAVVAVIVVLGSVGVFFLAVLVPAWRDFRAAQAREQSEAQARRDRLRSALNGSLKRSR